MKKAIIRYKGQNEDEFYFTNYSYKDNLLIFSDDIGNEYIYPSQNIISCYISDTNF